MQRITTLLLALLLSLPCAAAPVLVRLKPDPPIAVDGALGEWAAIPPDAALAGAEGQSIRAAWRQEALFIAVQTNAPVSSLPIAVGDAFRLRLEIKQNAVEIIDENTGLAVAGIQAAVKLQSGGQQLEVAIPWALTGIAEVKLGARVHLAIGGAAMELVLADASGGGVEHALPVVDKLALPRDAKQETTVQSEAPANGDQVVLALSARLDFPQVAGYAASLMVSINGQELSQNEIANKPMRVRARSGDVYSMGAGKRFSVYYAPDFTSADADPHYGLTGGVPACRLELDVTPWIVAGENHILFSNGASAPVDQVLHLADVQLIRRAGAVSRAVKGEAPQGPLEQYAPDSTHQTEFLHEASAGNVIRITVAGQSKDVASRFSKPDGTWHSDANPFYTHRREITREAEALIVRDTFVNLSGAPMPILQRHEWNTEGQEKLWLAGLEQPDMQGSALMAANPTTFAAMNGWGLGLVALDDVSRIHARNFSENGVTGMADEQLVLAPGKEYTAEWAIIPVLQPSYWDFINAARRLVGANFTIDGGFAFFRAGPLTDVWSDEETVNFLRFKDAKYSCATIDHPLYEGHYPHGTAFQRINHDNFRQAFERRRQLLPKVQNLVYFHCFIDVIAEGPERFADARLLLGDGTHGSYGQAHDRIYVPTHENSFGPEMAKSIGVILDEISAEGVYWDEHQYSRYLYHYGEPWDGVSGDIDTTTFQLRGLKSSVTLISEAWRLDIAKRILDRGPLIGNSPPLTRAMSALRFPCFVETGSITNCVQAHLYSPIALGDHLTEEREEDAYGTMLAALDYGCVYHWYNDMTVLPTHHHLTRYMFPITPMELHEGYIIGEERIVTNRSGLFGWGDAAAHETHVFDQSGREVPDFIAPTVERSGKTYTELRMPRGFSAAILRRATAG